MSLLTIERNFLKLPEVATALRLSEVRTIQRTIANAKKKKFEQSLALSQHVQSAFEWFKSEDGRAKFSEEGIVWTAEDFGLKVFGWQRSFFYKMLRVASLPSEVVERYSAQADEQGEDAQRSIEELLSYAKQVEEGSEEGGTGERPQIILSLVFNHPDGKTTIKINDAGQVKISGENIREAIQLLTSSINLQ
jgi:hypothetical protein